MTSIGGRRLQCCIGGGRVILPWGDLGAEDGETYRDGWGFSISIGPLEANDQRLSDVVTVLLCHHIGRAHPR